jgi:putative oxidoreductase
MTLWRSMNSSSWPDAALLILRLFFGITMAAAHGWPKLTRFSELQTSFPDPLGVGSLLSLVLVIFAELVCAAAVAAGLFFRLSLIPLVATMGVAAFIIHGQDPFQKQELALAYLAAYLALFVAGPGRYALDARR